MLTISSSSVFGNIQISLHLTPKNHFVFKEKEMVPVIYIEWPGTSQVFSKCLMDE